MIHIILALVKSKGTSSLDQIVRDSGFKREEVILILKKLNFIGKITFLSSREKDPDVCSVCSMGKLCQSKLSSKL